MGTESYIPAGGFILDFCEETEAGGDIHSTLRTHNDQNTKTKSLKIHGTAPQKVISGNAKN
jgi:hypothetical protein